MKVMRAMLGAMGATAVVAGIQMPTARAERMISQGQTITVRGVVPELRMIVVDERQRLRLITSNTNNNVAPRVVLLSVGGPEVPLTEAVRREYEALLAQGPADKIMTIRPAPDPLAELLPEFTRPARMPARYEILPTRGNNGEPPKSYWVSI